MLRGPVNAMRYAGGKIGGLAKGIANNPGLIAGGLGVGALAATKSFTNSAMRGTMISSPIVNAKGNTSGYGKRGIDSSRLAANGLVQGLHGNRRKY